MLYSKQLPYLYIQSLPAVPHDQFPLRNHPPMTSRSWSMKRKVPFAQPCQALCPVHCIVLEVFQHSCDVSVLCDVHLDDFDRAFMIHQLHHSFSLDWFDFWSCELFIICDADRFFFFLGKRDFRFWKCFAWFWGSFAIPWFRASCDWPSMFHPASLVFGSLFEPCSSHFSNPCYWNLM